MDPQDENPPEPDETDSKAKPTPPVDSARESKPSWTRPDPAAPSGDAAELELPLVTQAFDPLTEPELPLQAESSTVPPAQPEAALGTGAIEATVETQPALKAETDGAAEEEASEATVDNEPKPALPMQKSNPAWAQ